MHSDVATVLGDKPLLLFRHILSQVGFPNAQALIDNMAAGFKVVGKGPRTGVFPDKHQPASRSIAELFATARHAQSACESLGARTAEHDTAVWDGTQEELERGWLKGPFTLQELTSRLGPLVVPVPRFGVKQGDAYRVIDDFSVFGHNECAELDESVDPGGVDDVVNVGRAWLTAIVNGRHVRVVLSDGTMLHGELHASLSVQQAGTLVGKTWDLSKAYKRLARFPGHAALTCIAVWNPQLGKVQYFEQSSLAFGAKMNVISFNWVARALWFVMVVGLSLPVTHYFDDYPCICAEPFAHVAEELFENLCHLLGWELKVPKSSSGEVATRPPFAQSFVCLGVVFDLSASSLGHIKVLNKPSRVQELTDLAQSIKCLQRLSPAKARSAEGRFQYAAQQTFGRCAAIALRHLRRQAAASSARLVDDGIVRALDDLANMLVAMPPRLCRAERRRPVCIFTDGAAEEGTPPTAAAMIWDPESGIKEFFRYNVPGALVRHWKSDGKTQVINQVELHPILCACVKWKDQLSNRNVLFFIDNESAKFGLISGSSPAQVSQELISAVWFQLVGVGAFPWFARVPSCCNPADAPSRGLVSDLLKDGWTEVGHPS